MLKIQIVDDRGRVCYEQQFRSSTYYDKRTGKEKKLSVRLLMEKLEDWIIEEFLGG